MNDVPSGIRAHEHVEGLTLLFREKHTATRRGVRRWWVGLLAALAATLAGTFVLAGTGMLLTAASFDWALEGLVYGVLLALYLVSATIVVLGPTFLTVGALALGVVMYNDAGRTRVHLTVGVRGVTVQRKTEGQTTVFPPHDDLEVHVATSTRYPTLVIVGSGRRVEIPVLGDTETVEWLADQIRARCATAGNRASVPDALLQARLRNA